MTIPKINSAHGSDTRNILNRAIDLINLQGRTIQDLVAEGQLTEKQYVEFIGLLNNFVSSGEVNLDDLHKDLKEEIEKVNRKTDITLYEALSGRVENIIANAGDGTKDTEIVDARTDVRGHSEETLKTRLDNGQYDSLLYSDSIEGARKEPTFNQDGSIQRLRHYNETEELVREDNYYYEGNKIIEERSMLGRKKSFVHDLNTMSTVELNQNPTENLIKHPYDFRSNGSTNGWILNKGYEENGALVFEGDTVVVSYVSDEFKANTTYGLLYEVTENTLNRYFRLSPNFTGSYEIMIDGSVTGGAKHTTETNGKPERFVMSTYTDESGLIKIKNIRLFELPPYSQIKRDFETMTFDDLNIKY